MDADRRYASDATMSRGRCLRLQPFWFSSTASQSSSSGCVGRAPLRPKSNMVATSGLPKCRDQTWLTATRAASGFFGSAIQLASALRRPVLICAKDLFRDASVSTFDSLVLSAPRGGGWLSPGLPAALVASGAELVDD